MIMFVYLMQVDGDGKKASFTTKSEAITNDPLVVFIDKGSARYVLA
jgi:C-terminal processing protease CtpA/Prc